MQVPQYILNSLLTEEGSKDYVYTDKLGNLTAGVGHKLNGAELDQYKAGDKLRPGDLTQWFEADATKAYEAALSQAQELGYGTDDERFIERLTHTNFQLGENWWNKDVNPNALEQTWEALKNKNFDTAAKEAIDSEWFLQESGKDVNRAELFADSIKGLEAPTVLPPIEPTPDRRVASAGTDLSGIFLDSEARAIEAAGASVDYERTPFGEKAKPESLFGKFLYGFSGGLEQASSDYNSMKAAFNIAFGRDEAAAANLATADFYERTAAEYFQALTPYKDFYDNPTFAGGIEQVFGGIGKILPQAMETVASAIAGGGVGFILKESLKRGGKAATKQLLKDALKKYRMAGGGTAGLKALSPEERVVLEEAWTLGNRLVKGGSITGAFLQEYKVGTSQSLQEYREAGRELGKPEAFAALGLGLPQAIIGTAAEVFFAKALYSMALRKTKLGRIVAQGEKNPDSLKGQEARLFTLYKKFQEKGLKGMDNQSLGVLRSAQKDTNYFSNFARDMATLVGISTVSEGTAEGLQEGLSVTQRFAIDEDYDAADAKLRISEAIFLGAFAGGGARAVPGAAVTSIFNQARNALDDSFDYRARSEEQESRLGGVFDFKPESDESLNAQLDTVLDTDNKKDSLWVREEDQERLDTAPKQSTEEEARLQTLYDEGENNNQRLKIIAKARKKIGKDKTPTRSVLDNDFLNTLIKNFGVEGARLYVKEVHDAAIDNINADTTLSDDQKKTRITANETSRERWLKDEKLQTPTGQQELSLDEPVRPKTFSQKVADSRLQSVVLPGQGTFYSSDPSKVNRIAKFKGAATGRNYDRFEKTLASTLGYSEVRNQNHDFLLEVVNRKGEVVWQQTMDSTPAKRAKAEEAANLLFRSKGRGLRNYDEIFNTESKAKPRSDEKYFIRIRDPETAMEERVAAATIETVNETEDEEPEVRKSTIDTDIDDFEAAQAQAEGREVVDSPDTTQAEGLDYETQQQSAQTDKVRESDRGLIEVEGRPNEKGTVRLVSTSGPQTEDAERGIKSKPQPFGNLKPVDLGALIPLDDPLRQKFKTKQLVKPYTQESIDNIKRAQQQVVEYLEGGKDNIAKTPLSPTKQAIVNSINEGFATFFLGLVKQNPDKNFDITQQTTADGQVENRIVVEATDISRAFDQETALNIVTRGFNRADKYGNPANKTKGEEEPNNKKQKHKRFPTGSPKGRQAFRWELAPAGSGQVRSLTAEELGPPNKAPIKPTDLGNRYLAMNELLKAARELDLQQDPSNTKDYNTSLVDGFNLMLADVLQGFEVNGVRQHILFRKLDGTKFADGNDYIDITDLAKTQTQETTPLNLAKVISGGQNGADILFSRVAKTLGITTGGLMPKGFKTEEGNRPEYQTEFNMEEDTSADYRSRTKKNVENSDGTLILVKDANNITRGSQLTINFAKAANKPYLVITENTPANVIQEFIIDNNIQTLNGAGSRATYLGDTSKIEQVLTEAFSGLSTPQTRPGEAIIIDPDTIDPDFEPLNTLLQYPEEPDLGPTAKEVLRKIKPFTYAQLEMGEIGDSLGLTDKRGRPSLAYIGKGDKYAKYETENQRYGRQKRERDYVLDEEFWTGLIQEFARKGYDLSGMYRETFDHDMTLKSPEGGRGYDFAADRETAQELLSRLIAEDATNPNLDEDVMLKQAEYDQTYQNIGQERQIVSDLGLDPDRLTDDQIEDIFSRTPPSATPEQLAAAGTAQTQTTPTEGTPGLQPPDLQTNIARVSNLINSKRQELEQRLGSKVNEILSNLRQEREKLLSQQLPAQPSIQGPPPPPPTRTATVAYRRFAVSAPGLKVATGYHKKRTFTSVIPKRVTAAEKRLAEIEARQSKERKQLVQSGDKTVDLAAAVRLLDKQIEEVSTNKENAIEEALRNDPEIKAALEAMAAETTVAARRPTQDPTAAAQDITNLPIWFDMFRQEQGEPAVYSTLRELNEIAPPEETDIVVAIKSLLSRIKGADNISIPNRAINVGKNSTESQNVDGSLVPTVPAVAMNPDIELSLVRREGIPSELKLIQPKLYKDQYAFKDLPGMPANPKLREILRPKRFSESQTDPTDDFQFEKGDIVNSKEEQQKVFILNFLASIQKGDEFRIPSITLNYVNNYFKEANFDSPIRRGFVEGPYQERNIFFGGTAFENVGFPRRFVQRPLDKPPGGDGVGPPQRVLTSVIDRVPGQRGKEFGEAPSSTMLPIRKDPPVSYDINAKEYVLPGSLDISITVKELGALFLERLKAELNIDATRVSFHALNKIDSLEKEGKGINVMRKLNTDEHYGNPFTHLKTKTAAEVKVKSLDEALQSYRAWLLNEEHQDVRPKQREWIQNQLKQGKLKGQTLLYYSGGNKAKNHANVLRNLVNGPEPDLALGNIAAAKKPIEALAQNISSLQLPGGSAVAYETLSTIALEFGVNPEVLGSRDAFGEGIELTEDSPGTSVLDIYGRMSGITEIESSIIDSRPTDDLTITVEEQQDMDDRAKEIKQRRRKPTPEIGIKKLLEERRAGTIAIDDTIDGIDTRNQVFTESSSLKKMNAFMENYKNNIKNFKGNRTALWFGKVPYSYTGTSHPALAMPKEMRDLASQLSEMFGYPPEYFNSVLINKYEKGAKIAAHRDDEPIFRTDGGNIGGIATISFGGDAAVTITDGKDSRTINTSNGSVYVMPEGRFQFLYKHEVGPAESQRISLTFRHLPEVRKIDALQSDEVQRLESATTVKDIEGNRVPLERFKFGRKGPAQFIPSKGANTVRASEKIRSFFREEGLTSGLSLIDVMGRYVTKNLGYNKKTIVIDAETAYNFTLAENATKYRNPDSVEDDINADRKLNQRIQREQRELLEDENSTGKIVRFENVNVIIIQKTPLQSETDANASPSRLLERRFKDLGHEFGHAFLWQELGVVFKKGEKVIGGLGDEGKSFVIQKSDGTLVPVKNPIFEKLYAAYLEDRGEVSQYQDPEFGFEEWYADKFAAEMFNFIQGTTPKNAVQSFFHRIIKKLQEFYKRLGAEAQKRFGQVPPEFQQYMQNVRDIFKQNLTPQKVSRPAKAYYEARKSTIEAATIFNNLGQATKQGVSKIVSTYKNKSAREIWGLRYLLYPTDNLMKDFEKKYPKLARVIRMLRQQMYTRSKEKAGSTPAYLNTHARRNNSFFTQFLNIFDLSNTKYLAPNEKEEINEVLKIAEDFETNPINVLAEKAKANPTSREGRAHRVRLYLKNFHKAFLEPLGIPFNEKYFPRALAIFELINDPSKQEKLVELLYEYNREAVEKNPKLDFKEVVTRLLSEDEATLDEVDEGETDLTDLAVGGNRKRQRYFKNIPSSALREAGLLQDPSSGMREYLNSMAKRIQYNESFVVNVRSISPAAKSILKSKGITINQKEKDAGVVTGWKALEANLAEVEAVDPKLEAKLRHIVRGQLGKAGQDMSAGFRNTNSFLLFFNAVTLLTLAPLASFPDLAGPMIHGGDFKGFSDGINFAKEYAFGGKEGRQRARQFALDLGVIAADSLSLYYINAAEQNYMNPMFKKGTDYFFRFTGLEAYTQFTRIFAAQMGKQFMVRAAEGAKKGDKLYAEQLDALGVTPEQVEAAQADDFVLTGKIGRKHQAVRSALGKFVDESIVRPNAAERPGWANNPYFATIWQLKSFYYAYGKVIVGGIGRTMRQRYGIEGIPSAMMPAIMGAALLLPLTALGLELRELIKFTLGGFDASKFRTNRLDWGSYMGELIDRAGVLGPLGLLIPMYESQKYGDFFLGPAFGPSFERVEDLIFDAEVKQNIPVFGTLI